MQNTSRRMQFFSRNFYFSHQCFYGGITKADHRMAGCWFKGATGDAINTVLAAAGFNLRWLIRAVVRLFFGLATF
jgi:hypothetical protein